MVWWFLSYILFFPLFDKDRTHTLTHFDFGGHPFRKDFFPFHFILILIEEAKKTGIGGHSSFVLLCSYIFVFYGRRKERGFFSLGVGYWVGRGFCLGFFPFDIFVYFFFFPFLRSSIDIKHGLLSDSSACCGSEDERSVLCFIIFLLVYLLSTVVRGWLMV